MNIRMIQSPHPRQFLPGAGKICRAYAAETGFNFVNRIKFAGQGAPGGKICRCFLISLDG